MNRNPRLVCYPVPNKAVLQEDYIVRVRTLDSKEWLELKTYRVQVDMHDQRNSSMAFFDFDGTVEVEITFPRFFSVYKVDIRPLHLGIKPDVEEKRITFQLEKPANLSIEINEERYHNLQLFAGAIEEKPDKEAKDVLVVKGSLERIGSIGNEISKTLETMPAGRTLYIEAGIYYVGECLWNIPGNTNIYLEGGAIIIGGLVMEDIENVRIYGRGMVNLSEFSHFTYLNGLRMERCSKISIENVMFVNSQHYTIAMGRCIDITIKNVKAFSSDGWCDGIDMMSCKNVLIEQGFIRTSDDCIAIYGSRWNHFGDTRNIVVKDIVLWADVAHPTNIGTHGDHEREGDLIEDIHFENIDVLEHREFQAGYLGVMAINAGDKNTVRKVTYRDIRIEPFKHGKVLDIQVKWNKSYNPAPGKRIEQITFENIYITTGTGEEPSVIRGYSEKFPVTEVRFKNIIRDNRRTDSLEEANILVGEFAHNVVWEN